MLVQIILCLLAIWLLVERWQKRGMYRLWSQLKNDILWLPFIGHAYLFLGSDEDRMKVFKKFGMKAYETGGLLALWQGNRLYVTAKVMQLGQCSDNDDDEILPDISDAEIAELALKTCLEKDDVLKVSRMLTGNGSVFAPVPIWRPRRKFLAPTFSPKNLMQFTQIFACQSDIMVDQLKAAANKGSFSIWKYITSYSMDSVCESTLGVQVNAQRQPNQPFLKAFEEILKLDAARICQPWFYNDAIYRMTPYYKQHVVYKAELCGFIDNVIKNKRQTMRHEKSEQPESDQNDENRTKTFLELLIESSGGEKGYTDLELQEETLVLVLAGTDTSAVGASFTALMLSRHPDIQDKVSQELQDVFSGSNRPIVAEDLPRLRYLDAVIKETLRLYPPVAVIARKALKDLPLPSGLIVAKNCGILLNIWAIHRNPKYWGEDSMVYRPERWLETPLKHPAAFMPFSYGPRACLGNQYAMMSMKTAVATLCRHYRLHPASPVLDQHAPLRTKFGIMMKHVDDFELQLETRT